MLLLRPRPPSAYQWQRLLAALPTPKGGFVFYGDDKHPTGSVPTHARSGHIDGVYDITWLQRAMDVTCAEWKQPAAYSQKWAEHMAWVMRLFNNVTATQDLRGKLKLDALDEDLKGGADVAYERLQQAGWVPRWMDSTRIARLPVRAVLPTAITYSGRKTSRQQIDEFRKKHYGDDGERGSEGFVKSTKGDSVYTVVKYDDQNREISRDTIPAHRSSK